MGIHDAQVPELRLHAGAATLDEVWIAWDHIARVKEAISLEPDRFVVFPAPAGPKGRGYMPVIAGLAIPRARPTRLAPRPSSNT